MIRLLTSLRDKSLFGSNDTNATCTTETTTMAESNEEVVLYVGARQSALAKAFAAYKENTRGPSTVCSFKFVFASL